ncbi:hypothetical protein SAMN05216355_103100 [Actinomyces ruminicola]|uniref:Uncharacterized protein n=1 Tax=Actinomyces ruminicola TaxID=332524 RepID=A0A1H0B5Z1_9ACTO|nr:hypothetical protein SAMN05216355_103100 [Actinomyces ruminicola]
MTNSRPAPSHSPTGVAYGAFAGYRRERGALGRCVGGGVLAASSVWTAVPLFGPRNSVWTAVPLFRPRNSVWTAVPCLDRRCVRRGRSKPAQGVRTGPRGSKPVSVQRRCTVDVHLGAPLAGRGGRELADRHQGRGGRGPAGVGLAPLGACGGGWTSSHGSGGSGGALARGDRALTARTSTRGCQAPSRLNPPRPQSPRPSRTTPTKTPTLNTAITPMTRLRGVRGVSARTCVWFGYVGTCLGCWGRTRRVLPCRVRPFGPQARLVGEVVGAGGLSRWAR